jgi:glutamyl-tRNA reductase
VVDFCIWQRPPQAAASISPWPVFRTCRREIAFADRAEVPTADAERLTGEAAYAHLLQVICGLDSPIIGETEVMHQFRVFIDALEVEHQTLQTLGRRLLADARTVRAQHLGGLGSRSYGSAVRRHVRGCDRVAVIGTGMLCRDVLPFVVNDRRLVDVFGRRPAFESSFASVCYRQLDGSAGGGILEGQTALVVAAPVDASVIARVARLYASIACVIDLRGEAGAEPPPPIAPVVSLADVFNEMQRAAQAADRRVAAAKAEIARCARSFSSRAVLNPSGWHDLCA